MAKRGRPSQNGGAVYKRTNSEIWQVRYKDQKGEMIRESAATTDRQGGRSGSFAIASMRETRGACRFSCTASNSRSTSGPTGFWSDARSRRFGVPATIR
jgi:hypothetical protein